ncbi:hypothetical protein B9Z19DRAFT_1122463 [Tuber borchii]|uniref:Uncharacterized protein n=1 Tax=Tuber borchii TaxID=42251 RepID=A0A2T7A0A1_TUBBO|nr:hypothetical protein B9Z19DRAFT_1122463 [Tuber borchii]
MRTIVVLLSFVLLLQAGSDAKPIWPSRASPAADLSSLSLPEKPLSEEELAVQEYKDQQMDEYTDSTLIQLCDKNDIIPGEHDYFGSECPFDYMEFYLIDPPEEAKKGWKKIWEGIQGLFPASNKITDGGLDDEVMTTYGTDGSANGDLIPPLTFKRRKKGKGLDWTCGVLAGSVQRMRAIAMAYCGEKSSDSANGK